MDPNRFDTLTRLLAAPASRRHILSGSAAALLGALGLRAGAGAQVTQAQCGNKSCARDPGRCNDGCVCCGYGNGSSRCRPPGLCDPGTVLCPAGLNPCGGTCIDVSSDAANCGACGASCDDGNVCTSNSCVGGVCRNAPLADGTPCPGQPGECQAGSCVTCLPLREACTDDAQCCQDEPTVCGFNAIRLSNACCRPAGGTCTIFTGCCALLGEGFVASVGCSGDGICGGAGVECLLTAQCASGVCCGVSGTDPGRCCAAGQQCVAGGCTGP